MRRAGLGVRCSNPSPFLIAPNIEHRLVLRSQERSGNEGGRSSLSRRAGIGCSTFDVLFSRIQWDFPLQQIRIVPEPVRPPSPLRPPRTPKVLTFPARRDWMLGVRFSNPSPFLLAPNIEHRLVLRSQERSGNEGGRSSLRCWVPPSGIGCWTFDGVFSRSPGLPG